MTTDILRRATSETESVIALAAELIQAPSRGGLDDYNPVLSVAEEWLSERHLPVRRLLSPSGDPVGLAVEVVGGHPGKTWVLDACLDTAPFGDETAWSFSPTAGDVVENRLRGRGSADSKTAASMFSHITAAISEQADDFAGRLVLLLDVDEHTGNFGGAEAFMREFDPTEVGGVMIGYPGLDELVVGGRGVYRAALTVHGVGGHSGSSRARTVNAASRAAHLVTILDAIELPAVKADGFPLPAKITVTAIRSGEGYTTVPDRAEIALDVRLTDVLTADDTAGLIHRAAAELDIQIPGPTPTTVTPALQWPPYQLDPADEPAAALLAGAGVVGLKPTPRVAGPSNIGNLFATRGIPAIAGFGLPFHGLHGTDEWVDLSALPAVQATYHHAITSLLLPTSRS